MRETFDLCLPHPKTKRHQSINGNPSFSSEALAALKNLAVAKGTDLLCTLVIDEMAIRCQVEWDGESYVGYVDFGTTVDDNLLPVAKEALVYMDVSVNELWKHKLK